MEPTNHPTPVILDNEALAELERDLSACNSAVFPITVEMAAALCQTVRALRAEIAEWESHRDGIIEAVKTAEARVEELEESNTALREQLAEAQAELGEQAYIIKTHGDTICKQAERLAQVEKEAGVNLA